MKRTKRSQDDIIAAISAREQKWHKQRRELRTRFKSSDNPIERKALTLAEMGYSAARVSVESGIPPDVAIRLVQGA